ncbi:MAG: 2-isopropylmalate synthase [Anaerolineales bacterium]|nr:2-isopropylmalate synthase [Anaerolineales bacterium]
MDRINIFDATLYGGGQAPGIGLTIDERSEIARLLDQMGVDVIQAGFPIASPRDYQTVSRLAGEIKESVICALARAREEDIDVAVAVLKGAARPRLQIGLGVSDSYITRKLKTTRDEALEMAVNAVQYAHRYIGDVQYYAGDACRADLTYLYCVLEAVIEAGAVTVNIPDAIGFMVPSEWGALIRGIRENVPNIDKAVISVHCHNDLGMATANTLEALLNGARQAECAVNGIGERTGNARLEEIVMTIRSRQDVLKLSTGINTRLIHRTSQLVSYLTGLPIQPNKAIVGEKAFSYTSGMYENGVLRGRTDSEILDPKDIGILEARDHVTLLTGREGLRRRLKELDFNLTDTEFERVYKRFRDVAKKKPDLEIRDLEAIVTSETHIFMKETFELENVQVMCGNNVLPVAAVRLNGPSGETHWASSSGNGPIDAVYKAIDTIVDVPNRVLEYSLEAMTEGVDAVAKVSVRIEGNVPVGSEGDTEKRVFLGRGADTDSVIAGAKAYLFAINRLLAAQQASRRRQAITGEVQRALREVRAQSGASPAGDFMGWSLLRGEDLI